MDVPLQGRNQDLNLFKPKYEILTDHIRIVTKNVVKWLFAKKNFIKLIFMNKCLVKVTF